MRRSRVSGSTAKSRGASSRRRWRVHRLPAPLTPLIGRRRELAEIAGLMRGTRLLTLTGTGGSGKTRLAQAVGARSGRRFPDGAFWVDLAGISDGAAVPSAVAVALGLREQPRRDILTLLSDYVATRRLLLILDNCEHLLAAVAPLVERLLRAAPGLRILTTSREPLGLPGETTWLVPPLSLPEASSDPDTDTALAAEAVQLFVARVRDADLGFRLTAERVPPVVRICRALDGLPLALELAAAQTRGLGVEEIAARLGDRLSLLRAGQRTLRPQHQTLRAAIDWSYALLSQPERELLARLSVFAGGFTIDAVEAVCATGDDAPALVTQLVNKSLVVADLEGGRPARYRLLDTIRTYAAERLEDSGQADAVRAAHMMYFLRLAEESAETLRGPHQQAWIRRLLDDQDNLRAALQWAEGSGRRSEGVQMAGALWRFWNVEGFWREGRRWLERALAPGDALQPLWRARAAFGAGVLAWYQHDHGAARRWLHLAREIGEQLNEPRIVADALRQLALVATAYQEHREAWKLGLESLRLFEEAQDAWGIAAASRVLGFHASGHAGAHVTDRIDLDLAARYFARSLELAKSLGDHRGIGWSLLGLGIVVLERGDRRTSTQHLEAAWRTFIELGDRRGLASALLYLARTALDEREFDRADTLATESVRIDREAGEVSRGGGALLCLADIARARGDVIRAEAIDGEALSVFKSLGAPGGIADALQGLGFSALRRRRWKRTATLLGAATAVRTAFDIVLLPSQREPFARAVGTTRAGLGGTRFETAWQAGLAMTMDAAIAFATEQPVEEAGDAQREGGVTLTERELEVAALVARGLSNREIAQALSISRRTADSHIQHILNKLSFRSRAQIAAWAVASGIISQ